MQMLRSRVMSLVLTIFVGLGLATSALAHRIPTGAEQALQALQVAGLPLGVLCGQAQGKTSCPQDGCPVCPAGAAVLGAAFTPPDLQLIRFQYVLAMPQGTPPPMVRLLLGHDAQGPPAGLI